MGVCGEKYGLTRSKRGHKKTRLWRRLSCPQAGEERIPGLNQRPGTMSDMVMDFNSALHYAGITAMMLPSTSYTATVFVLSSRTYLFPAASYQVTEQEITSC